MEREYFYGCQSEQFSFYRIPKILFTDESYSGLSTDAKLLYGILLDRMSLSTKSGWLDEQGRVYIIFPIESIMESLGCARQKATKLLDELEQKYGLIERQRRGMGKPNLIYVKSFLPVSGESYFQKYENQTSGSMKIKLQEVRFSNGINTDINNTDINETESIPSLPSPQEARHPAALEAQGIEGRERYRQYFEDVLEFEALLADHPNEHQILNEILELLVDTTCSTRETIRIGGDNKPKAVVDSVLLKLKKEHIDFVLLGLSRNTTKVRNMRQYLLTSLYNAPFTIGNYYKSLVNHDMAEGW